MQPPRAQTQMAWKRVTQPLHAVCSRTGHSPRRTACLPHRPVEPKSFSPSISNHADNFLRHSFKTSLLEVPKRRSTDHPLPRCSFCRLQQAVTGCVSSDSSLPFQPPHELPNCCLLAALSHRETRLQGVLSSLGHVQHTVGLQAAAPRPSAKS